MSKGKVITAIVIAATFGPLFAYRCFWMIAVAVTIATLAIKD